MARGASFDVPLLTTWVQRYWDVRYQPGNYNFVEFVVERGYSVLYYDRLGTGQSQVWVLPFFPSFFSLFFRSFCFAQLRSGRFV